jgi:hypothetical protein
VPYVRPYKRVANHVGFWFSEEEAALFATRRSARLAVVEAVTALAKEPIFGAARLPPLRRWPRRRFRIGFSALEMRAIDELVADVERAAGWPVGRQAVIRAAVRFYFLRDRASGLRLVWP